MNTIDEQFLHRVELHPDRAAIIQPENPTSITYSELNGCVNRLAHLLQKRGIQPGDPVLLFIPMSIPLYATLLALLRIGASAMFIDPSAGLKQIRAACRTIPPRAFIGIPKAHLFRLLVPELRTAPAFHTGSLALASQSLDRAPDGLPQPVPLEAACPALITFTSGSTGQPKAAMRTHGFLLAQHKILHESIQMKEGECDLTTLPVFLLANLASGLTSIIPCGSISRPGFINPTPVLQQIAKHQITRCAASPAFFQQLLSARDHSPLAQLDKIYTGGAPVFPPLLDALRSAAHQAQIDIVYGSTEAEPISHYIWNQITPHLREQIQQGRGLPVGIPIPEIELRILSDRWGTPIAPLTQAEFERLTVPQGTVGEIIVTGPHVLKTYANPQHNAETKISVDNQTWHRTGDAGFIDTDGQLWLLGRCSEIIRDTHGTAYPFAIETLLSTLPGITRTAFLLHQGKRTLAVQSNKLNEPLLQKIRRLLTPWEPYQIIPLPNIPVDARHNAKINYPALRKRLKESKTEGMG